MSASMVSAIIPTYNRRAKLGDALTRILECDPAPAEVIVHIDGGDTETAPFLRSNFPEVKIIESGDRVGPGGGRNRLITEAAQPVVASFDDDSYPIDRDYFARLELTLSHYPEAAVLASATYYNGEEIQQRGQADRWVADFVGCGCAYRRAAFLETKGFVPLPLAYGMEEVDLALQLQDAGWRILESPWLRVRHEADRSLRPGSRVAAAFIANCGLLTYLRYPVRCWWIGVAQAMKMAWYLASKRRVRGIFLGIGLIPVLTVRYRRYRATVKPPTIARYLWLRKHPEDAAVVQLAPKGNAPAMSTAAIEGRLA